MKLLRLSLAAVLALGLAGPAAASSDASGVEQALVESATTPEQHAALARQYREKAESMHRITEEHRVMAKTYAGKSMRLAQRQKHHCEQIALFHTQLAAEFDKLAEGHEAEARP